ncbi:MAG: FkbM family methyltransferase [Planctomycetota bacterium]
MTAEMKKDKFASRPERKRCWDRYRHTLRMAYRIRGWETADVDTTIPEVFDTQMSPEELSTVLLAGLRERLEKSKLAKTLLKEPKFRYMQLNGRDVVLPLCNTQGVEWYQDSPIANYDFVNEDALGLHTNAKVIYDFGGHHGVWALYYATVVGQVGRVYSFEPSLINIEMSAMLMLVNGIDNVINVAGAIGAQKSGDSSSDMLIDFVENDQIEIVSVRDCCWDYADFVKMDIEGFEYEILTANPWIFDMADNLHLEIHIPHLERRGLDYRRIMDVIPFHEFDVFNHVHENPVGAETELSGFCSLMLKRREPSGLAALSNSETESSPREKAIA